jgi:hypothetical protein
MDKIFQSTVEKNTSAKDFIPTEMLNEDGEKEKLDPLETKSRVAEMFTDGKTLGAADKDMQAAGLNMDQYGKRLTITGRLQAMMDRIFKRNLKK